MNKIEEYTKTLVLSQEELNGRKSIAGFCPACGRDLAEPCDSDTQCPLCRTQLLNQLAPGNIVGGKYRLLSALGHGGFSTVFIAHPLDDISFRCVVKVLRKNSNSVSRKRFAREAAILRSIQHDNIVKILDCWSDAIGDFIVLEYIEGSNLNACRQQYDLDESSVLIIAKEVAKALGFIWENFRLIHRDIKPSNIVINGEGHIKLLDFGISKFCDPEGAESQLTMDQAGLGTPGYMSPEQFADAKNALPQSDMFSLGATIFYMLTGEAPFHGKNLAECYDDTIKHSPPDIQKRYPQISPGLKELLDCMMQPDPGARPENWGIVIDTLHWLIN